MRLQMKALAVALAVVWGAAVFLTGLAQTVWPAYGAAFWQLVASIYPGVGAGGIGAVLLATLYAIIDGGVCGLIFAGVYNAAAGPAQAS